MYEHHHHHHHHRRIMQLDRSSKRRKFDSATYNNDNNNNNNTLHNDEEDSNSNSNSSSGNLHCVGLTNDDGGGTGYSGMNDTNSSIASTSTAAISTPTSTGKNNSLLSHFPSSSSYEKNNPSISECLNGSNTSSSWRDDYCYNNNNNNNHSNNQYSNCFGNNSSIYTNESRKRLRASSPTTTEKTADGLLTPNLPTLNHHSSDNVDVTGVYSPPPPPPPPPSTPSQYPSLAEDLITNNSDRCDVIIADKPPMPSRQDVLQAIRAIEETIKDITSQLSIARSSSIPAPESNVQSNDNKNIITTKNKIQQIYFENRQKSAEVYHMFDKLLSDSMSLASEEPYAPLKDVDLSELPDIVENEKKHALIVSELEEHIRSKWEAIHQRNLDLAMEYRTLKQKWLEKQEKKRKNLSFLKDEDNYKPMTRHNKTLAVIPRMLTEDEKKYEFISRNGFVDSETVLREYQEQRNYESAWTEEEKRIFMEKFALYPKNCRKIASFLPNKTTYDCVNFYYNNKLTPEFKKLKDELKGKRKYKKNVIDEGKTRTAKTPVFDQSDEESYTQEERQNSSKEDGRKQKSSTLDTWTDDEITNLIALLQQYGKNFAQISQNLKTKSASQCKVFFNMNNMKFNLESYLPKTTRSGRNTLNINSKPSTKSRKKDLQTSKNTISTSRPQISEPKKTKKQVSVWTVSEKDSFLEYLQEYGRDWKKLAELIPTKTEMQIKNFFQNYKVKLGLAQPPGAKIRKKKKRISVLFDPAPADLCQLADLAQQISENGTVNLNELNQLYKDSTSNVPASPLLTPPPPSLLHINPNAETSYRMNNSNQSTGFNYDKQFSKEFTNGVNLLASMALQDRGSTLPPPPLPLSQNEYPSLQDVMIQQQTNGQREAASKNTGSISSGNTVKVSYKPVAPRRKVSSAASTVPNVNRARKSPHQESKPVSATELLSNTLPIYAFPSLMPAIYPMTNLTTSDLQQNIQATSTASPVESSKKESSKKRTQRSQPQQHGQAQPSFLPWANSMESHSSTDFNTSRASKLGIGTTNLSFPENPSITSHSTTGSSTAKDHSMAADNVNNTFPFLHAFSAVLSNLPPMMSGNSSHKTSSPVEKSANVATPTCAAVSSTTSTTEKKNNIESQFPNTTASTIAAENQLGEVSIQELEQGNIEFFSKMAAGSNNAASIQSNISSISPSNQGTDCTIQNQQVTPALGIFASSLGTIGSGLPSSNFGAIRHPSPISNVFNVLPLSNTSSTNSITSHQEQYPTLQQIPISVDSNKFSQQQKVPENIFGITANDRSSPAQTTSSGKPSTLVTKMSKTPTITTSIADLSPLFANSKNNSSRNSK
jgi:hypothetical protein